MSGCPHEEVDNVGVEGGQQAKDGLHTSQQAVGNGLWYQDDPYNQPRHDITPNVLFELVFWQPEHHGEESCQGGLDPRSRACHALLQLGFKDRNRWIPLVNPPLQEKRGCQRGPCDPRDLIHCLIEEEEAARWEGGDQLCSWDGDREMTDMIIKGFLCVLCLRSIKKVLSMVCLTSNYGSLFLILLLY